MSVSTRAREDVVIARFGEGLHLAVAEFETQADTAVDSTLVLTVRANHLVGAERLPDRSQTRDRRRLPGETTGCVYSTVR